METHAPEEIFISYCTQNDEKANMLLACLEELGMRCWIAPRNIAGGDTWPVAITKALQNCRIMVIVYSSASQDSVYVVNEATIALKLNKYIVPIRIEDVPVQKSLELLLASCQWKDAFRNQAKEFHEIAGEVYVTLKRIVNEPHDDEVLRKYNAKRTSRGKSILVAASVCLVVLLGLAFKFNVITQNTSDAVPQAGGLGKGGTAPSASPAVLEARPAPGQSQSAPVMADNLGKAERPAAKSIAPAAPQPAAAPADTPRVYAALTPPPPPKPAGDQLKAGQDVKTRIARFVSNYQDRYNRGGAADVITAYGPVVNYFGTPNKSKDSLYGDMINFFDRWQKRRSRLKGDMVVEDTADPTVKRVSFSYDFYRERGEEQKKSIQTTGYYKNPKDDRWCSSGVATDTLTLKVLDDSIQIIGESQTSNLDKPKNACNVIP